MPIKPKTIPEGTAVQPLVTGSILPFKQECSTCSYWTRLTGVKSMGECMLSAKARPAPIVTLDQASCSGWDQLGASNAR